jgi:hypothetical protein
MSSLVTVLIAFSAVVAAVALAYLPLRVILDLMARNLAIPIRAFIERRRDRRLARRESPERRQTGY